MTKQREFKALVRERMGKTGERYTTAQAQLLSKLSTPTDSREFPGLLPRYDRFGGVQGDMAVLHNVLQHAGIKSPLTRQPYSETTINGLCGGPGFLYAVFEYKGWPPMLTMVLRSRSMPDLYVGEGLNRLGVKITQKQSGGPGPARKALDEALDAGKAAICTVDIAMLPWYGMPEIMGGMGPHTVAVVGRDGQHAWLDDRAPRPIRISLDQLAKARARYRHAKSRLITIDGPADKFDAKQAVRDAISDTANSYSNYAVPKQFQSNCGFAGLEKFRLMLTDAKDKKGWPTIFAEKDRAYAGLSRAYACIQYEYTAPSGGRASYADFLRESAKLLAAPQLNDAATLYRQAGEGWTQLAAMIADAPDDAVKRSCELADQRAELLDHDAVAAEKHLRDWWANRTRLGQECRLSRDAAMKLYGRMSEVVGSIMGAERAGVEAMLRSLK